MASDILDKLAKILNQAEKASTQEEADAFFERAQMLSTKYSIELSVARSHVAKSQQREMPTVETIDIGEQGSHNLSVFCELFMAIGQPNDITFNISNKSTYVVAFGMPSDIEVTKAIYASVVQQMMQAVNEFIRKGEFKNEMTTVWSARKGTWVTKPVDTRVAKRTFFDGYTSSIAYRLAMAKQKAEVEAIREQDEQMAGSDESSSTALVLANKREEIAEFYKSRSTARGSWRGGNKSHYSQSYSSREAGRTAGNRAILGSSGSIAASGRKAIGNG